MSERAEAGGGAIEADGCRLAWRATGQGPPLLLINGYAATAADWDPTFLSELGKGLLVICPDNRGMGESSLGAGEITIARLAADCIALLDALEIERAAVAGWSMGGFVAQELAAGHPERVGQLVLMSTDPGGPQSVPADAAIAARLFDHSGAPREQASRLIGLLFPPGVAEQVDAEFGEAVAAARAALSPQALAAQESAMRRWSAEPAEARLAAIEAPALVMAGEEDAVIPAANSSLLAAAIGDARLRLFPRAGHAFIAQEAPRAAALIRDFTGP